MNAKHTRYSINGISLMRPDVDYWVPASDMNLETFKAHIKTVDHNTLDAYHAEISKKLAKARNQQIKLGYALALDELCIEAILRKTRLTKEELNVSDDELLAALQA